MIDIEKMAAAIRETLEKEMGARDRVDISLESYEGLKKNIRDLEYEVSELKKENEIWRDIFKRFDLPPATIIDMDRMEVMNDLNPLNFRRKYRLEFEVNEADLRLGR